MRAGKLRHLITIQQPTETNTAGNVTTTWSTYVQLWAEIMSASGNEGFLSDQRFATVTHTIRTRYYSGITPKMRAVLGSRVFKIHAALNWTERDRELRLLCTEEV